ncbi:MAG TPA: isochorismatase family cysteine hydrolase [Propionibacteriaceae bacterium]|jgi:nicotinamidase-related amidase
MNSMDNDALHDSVRPGATALLIIELQEGTIGSHCAPGMEELQAAARTKEIVPNTSRVLAAARSANVDVFHCLTFRRRDYRGSQTSDRLLSQINGAGHGPFKGTPAAQSIDGVEPVDGEFELWRSHASTSFHDTGLDSLLRNMRITTVVLTGISLNYNVFGTAMEATNRNYKVIVPRDCVAGWPLEYGEMIIDHSLAHRARITTSAELAEAWQAAPA